MSRLIDADEETRFANENLPDAHAGVITAFLRDCATVDPVKHGKWISNGRNTCSGSRYKCSSCGHTTGYKHLRIYKFCPNCGAMMEGGDENG